MNKHILLKTCIICHSERMIMLLFSVCCVHISLMFCCLYICLLGITRHKAKSTAYSKSTAVDLDFHIHISGFVLPNPHMWIPNPRTSQIHAPQPHVYSNKMNNFATT